MLNRVSSNDSRKSLFKSFPHFVAKGAALTCLLMLWALSLNCAAQTGQGSITGRVMDANGALVAHAAVLIKNTETGGVIPTKTNSSGYYSVGSLNPATYTVTVTAAGFETSVIQGVTLQAAASVEIDVPMKVGGADVSVTVTSESSLLSKDTSDVMTTVDHTLVEDLPYPERSSLEAALLVPGVIGDPGQVGGIQSENPAVTGATVAPGASIGIAGAPAGTASIVVDGSDVTQSSYARAGVNLSGKLVQETTVITGGLSAKYGRTSGGSIIQASRAGASAYHGSITWRHTDPFFQADSLTAVVPAPRPTLRENFYGFYVGGPVWFPRASTWLHNTFFYVGVEPARLANSFKARGAFFTPDDLAGHLNNTLPLLNQTILKTQGYAAAVAAPRTGGLYYHTDPNYACPTSAPGVPCGPQVANSGLYSAIPNNDVSGALAQNPFAQFVMSLMPTPSNPGPYITFDNPNATYQTDGTNATYTRGVHNTDNRYSFRIDKQFGDRNQMFFRYTVIPVVAVRYDTVAETNPLNQQPTDTARNYDMAVGFTHIFSNAVVSNAHYSFLRALDTRTPPPIDLTQDFGAKYGLTPATLGHGFPYLGGFSVSGITYHLNGGVAPGGTGPSEQVDENFIFGDDVTWQHGRHLFQFGIDLRWLQSTEYNNGYTGGGAYTFGQATTNNGSSGGAPLATFQLGEVTSFIDSPIAVPGYYRWRYDAGYFQDDWRVTAKVTLNLGVRYNVETPRMEKFNNQPLIALNQNNIMNGVQSSAALCFQGSCGMRKTLWPINWKEVEPRIGIAVATSPRTTVRAAYSISHLPLTGYFNQPLPDLSLGGTLGGTTGGQRPNQIVDIVTNPISTPTSYYSALNAARGAPLVTIQGITPSYVNQSDVVPYTETWNFTVQYQPKPTTLVQVTYQGLRGLHLMAPFSGGAAGDISAPTIPVLVSAIQSQANLSQTLPTCGTTTAAPGCGNPFGVMQGTTLVQENKLQSLYPYQNFFNVNIPDDFERDGDSVYHALALSVTERMGRNLSLLSSYIWSKSIDDVANTTFGNNSSSGGSPNPQIPSNLKAERSVSVTDQPSRLKAGYTYTLPIGTGQRFKTGHRVLDNIIGNWRTSGIYTVQSGYPNYVTLGSAGYFNSVTPSGINGCNTSGTVNYCVEGAQPAGDTFRPNLIPGVPLINKNWKRGGGGVSSSNFVPYINAQAFGCTVNSLGTPLTCPAPGSPGNPMLGNAPRTLAGARTPRETFFDARVMKEFVLEKRYHLDLTATLNNALNHPIYFALGAHNLENADTVSTTTGTTTINPASTTWGQLGVPSNFARVIRVGAEFTF